MELTIILCAAACGAVIATAIARQTAAIKDCEQRERDRIRDWALKQLVQERGK